MPEESIRSATHLIEIALSGSDWHPDAGTLGSAAYEALSRAVVGPTDVQARPPLLPPLRCDPPLVPPARSLLGSVSSPKAAAGSTITGLAIAITSLTICPLFSPSLPLR